jgi:threonine/homoserine/homoserine lactone efflux protein
MVATAMHSLIVMLAGTAQKFLENRKRRLIARRVLSVALAGIAIWFALTTGKEGL